MNIKWGALICLIFLAVTSLSVKAQPTQCPTTASIIAAGLLTAERDDEDKMYVAGQINNYNTPDLWAFIIGVPYNQASSTIDALNKARSVLPFLSGMPTPFFYSGKWVCLYNDLPYGFKTLAVTPINFGAMSHASMFQAKK